MGIDVTDATFATEVVERSKTTPVVVDFWADWCGPCHYIAPSVEQLAAEFNQQAVIAKLNVDDNPATPLNYGILGIPTLIYFKDGAEVDRVIGVTSYQELAQRLRALLPAAQPA